MSDDTATPTPDESGPQVEIWAHAGLCLTKDDVLVESWVPDGGASSTTLLYKKTKGARVIGGLYEVKVTRAGERVTRHGDPLWTGKRVSNTQAAQWAVDDRVARIGYQRVRDHVNAAKVNALDEALKPLEVLMRGTRTRVEQEALIATILRRLLSS